MSPEIAQMFANMQAEINELKTKLVQFQNAAQMDPEVIRMIGQVISDSSDKVVTSENGSRSVNEAGVNSYTITFLNPPDRFIRIGDNNIPAYDN